LEIQRGLNGVVNINMGDYVSDLFINNVILANQNSTALTNLTTTTTNSIISSVNNINNRTTTLESVVSGGQGNALLDFYSTTNSVLLLNNKSLICDKIETNAITKNITAQNIICQNISASTLFSNGIKIGNISGGPSPNHAFINTDVYATGYRGYLFDIGVDQNYINRKTIIRPGSDDILL
jgi:hypothetical protein